MCERVKPIVGYEEYKICECGTVYRKNGKRLNLRQAGMKGYEYIYARFWKSSREHSKRVHRLVWQTFMGPIPGNREIHHKDRDRKNNRLDNLACVTRKENCQMKGKYKKRK